MIALVPVATEHHSGGICITVKIVVVGGGFAGCAASMSAARAGADVTLLERTDLLLGNGLLAGNMDWNGRLTVKWEAKMMGGGELFEALESIALYKDANIPGMANGYVYDVGASEPLLRSLLSKSGVSLSLETLAVDVCKDKEKIVSVKLKDGTKVEGNAFIDCTGSFGGMANCAKYGRGCVMCVMRCPAYGDRISIATKAGVPELTWHRQDGTPGAVSSAFCIVKDSLSQELRSLVEEKGIVIIPLQKEFIDYHKLKVASVGGHVTGKEHVENIVLVNIGYAAKANALVYLPLEFLRKVKGFENARFESPLAAGRYNSIRFLSIAPRDNNLKVKGLTNMFCAGEKSGPSGITEAIVTGCLAGHNAVRSATGKELLALPRTTAIGDFIAYIGEQMSSSEGLKTGYGFSGGFYFERMKKLGLYTTDEADVKERIKNEGLTNILAERLA